MTKISEAVDQYTGICKEAMMTSAAKLSKSIEKVIIEVLLLYSGAVDNAIHLLLAARKLRTRGSPAASMADPRPGKPPRRHHRRTTSSPSPHTTTKNLANNLRKIFLCHKSRPISDGYDVHSRRPLALSPLAHDTQKKRTRDGRAFDDFQRITAMPQILSCSFYIANLNDKPSTFRT